MQNQFEEDEFELAADMDLEAQQERERLWNRRPPDEETSGEPEAGVAVALSEGDESGQMEMIVPEGESDREAVIEAILFTMGDSVELRQLAAALDETEPVAKRAVEHLRERLERENRGMQIIELDGAYQMCTRPQFYENLIRVAKAPKRQVLTDVLMETLSIVAYKQPVTKMEIARIRGVSSDHAVNRLVEYGLICEVGRMDAPGRPVLFATTEEFLRRFGVTSTSDLPSVNPEQEEEIVQEVEEELQLKLDEDLAEPLDEREKKTDGQEDEEKTDAEDQD